MAKAKKPPKGANTGPPRKSGPQKRKGNPVRKDGSIFGKPVVTRKVRSA